MHCLCKLRTTSFRTDYDIKTCWHDIDEHLRDFVDRLVILKQDILVEVHRTVTTRSVNIMPLRDAAQTLQHLDKLDLVTNTLQGRDSCHAGRRICHRSSDNNAISTKKHCLRWCRNSLLVIGNGPFWTNPRSKT